MRVKALFLPAEKPYNDFGDVLQIARAEACEILKTNKVKVLNILSCSYPIGYVVVVCVNEVVQTPGGTEKNIDKK